MSKKDENLEDKIESVPIYEYEEKLEVNVVYYEKNYIKAINILKEFVKAKKNYIIKCFKKGDTYYYDKIIKPKMGFKYKK